MSDRFGMPMVDTRTDKEIKIDLRNQIKQLTADNARLRAALEKISGIRGRDLSEPWSDTELAEITLKGQP